MTMAMRAEALSLVLALFALSACALPGKDKRRPHVQQCASGRRVVHVFDNQL